MASVWAPGSPFSLSSPDSPTHLETANHDQLIPSQKLDTAWRTADNLTTNLPTTNLTTTTILTTADDSSSYISVTLLLVGKDV